MVSYLSDPPTPPGDFHAEKFTKKSTLRDYAVYAVILVVLLGGIAGSIYYFTRSEPEKDKLRAKIEHTKNEVLLQDGKESVEPPPLPELKQPKQLDGLLDDAPKPSSTAGSHESKTGAVSTYAGGRKNAVVPSDDPALPKAGDAFIQFAETLKMSGVLQGSPAKAMLNGHLFRAGEILDAELGVIFVGVEGTPRDCILLRDKTGAELRVTY